MVLHPVVVVQVPDGLLLAGWRRLWAVVQALLVFGGLAVVLSEALRFWAVVQVLLVFGEGSLRGKHAAVAL